MGGIPLWLSTTLLGFGTVFVGLICLIFIAKLMSFFCRKSMAKPAPAAAPAAKRAEGEIPDRAAFDAAIAAGIATYMGTNPAGLRILSIKKAD